MKQATMTTAAEHSNGSAKGTAPFIGQPTLVIGIGGIGHRIVLMLKALLLAIFGEVPAGIRLLVFDIDEESLSVQVGERFVALEPEAELFCLGPIPLARIRHNLDRLETIRDRLPSLLELPPIAVARAARQSRPIGALAFLWRFPQIRSIVQKTLWRLAGRDQRGDDSITVDPGRGLKIIQVGSNCGGTHSGMYLDMGLLVRSELEALGTLGEASTVIGLGVLPGVFRGIFGPNLVPNTVAALKELEAVTSYAPQHNGVSNGRFTLTYRDGTVIHPAQPPFDMYLLIDAVDEGGRVWTSLDDLTRMAARAIWVLAASRLGEQSEGELDNLGDILTQMTPDGHGTFFGSIGLSVLEFPAEAIFALFSARQAHSVTIRDLLRPSQVAQATAEAEAWLDGQGLAADALRAELTRDESGLPIAALLDPPASLSRLPEHQVPQEAIQFVQVYERVRLDGDYRAAIRQNAQNALQSANGRLAVQLRSMLDDPAQGLRQAHAFLEAAASRLARQQSTLTARRQALRSEETQAEQSREYATAELIRSTEAMVLVRRGRVSGALDRFLQASQAVVELRLEGLIVEQSLAVLGAVVEKSREASRMLSELAGRLQAAAALLARQAEEQDKALERRQGHPALVLVDGPYLERLYQAHAPDRRVALSAVLASPGQPGLLAWRSLAPEALAERIKQANQAAFAPVRAMTIDEVLAGRNQYSAEARLAALLEEAKPAWNLDETRLPGGDASLRRIQVVGVPDHTRSAFRGDGTQVVSLHDPHTVLALSLTLGAPYTALQAWPAYLTEYEQARGQRPLHVLPGFQSEGEEAGLVLALGLIFGQVFSRGVFFYYRPADELEADMRLGQGATNALQALAAHGELIREILSRVEGQIEHIGIGQALEKLAAYCAPVEGDDELSRGLKQAVRGYMQMLQANARVSGGRGAK